MDNNETRRKILKILYEKYQQHPYGSVSHKELIRHLGISKNELYSNIVYLDEKGYARLVNTIGSLFFSARITIKGIDLIEDESEFNVKFPVRQNVTHIEGDMIGVVSQGDNAQISSQVSIQIGENFNNILQKIDSNTDFDAETKESLKSKVQEIKAEIQKTEPDGSKIKSAFDFLKQKAKWVYDEIVMNPVIASTLAEIAKRHFFGSNCQ